MKKLNCWEYKQCGREPNGKNAHERGVCPASMESRLADVHGGWNAGRSCWVVAGTLCHGDVQGTFAEKFKNCEKCDFYQKVYTEEFPRFHLSSVLRTRLKDLRHDYRVTDCARVMQKS